MLYAEIAEKRSIFAITLFFTVSRVFSWTVFPRATLSRTKSLLHYNVVTNMQSKKNFNETKNSKSVSLKTETEKKIKKEMQGTYLQPLKIHLYSQSFCFIIIIYFFLVVYQDFFCISLNIFFFVLLQKSTKEWKNNV